MTIGFLENPTITGIKILAIAYVTILYGVGGIFTGILLDTTVFKSLYVNAELEKKKSLFRQTAEIIYITIIYGIVTYLGKNILQTVPFPLEGVDGFSYMRVKEVASGTLYGIFMLMVVSTLYNKITIYRLTISNL